MASDNLPDLIDILSGNIARRATQDDGVLVGIKSMGGPNHTLTISNIEEKIQRGYYFLDRISLSTTLP
jgi:hypothetical protein